MALEVTAALSTSVWRVGYRPEPLAWSGWEHATNGVFPGRWDDPDGRFRTIYVAESLLGCFLEVLAHARKEAYMAAALEEIHEDEEDAKQFPTLRPGQVHKSWLEPRCVATAVLYGNYCRVTAAGSVAQLYPMFIAATLKDGHDDFDAALLKSAGARKITRAVAAYLYLQPDIDGVEFASRHGDEARMWAVFEQPHDPAISGHLTRLNDYSLQTDNPDLLEAFRLLGLEWVE